MSPHVKGIKPKNFFLVYRKLQEHWLYSQKPFCELGAWIDILCQAAYKPRRLCIKPAFIDLTPGQLHTSLSFLSQRWGWSKKRITKFLFLLEKDGMIATKGDHNGTTISVIKWSDYQSEYTPVVYGGVDAKVDAGVNEGVEQIVHHIQCIDDNEVSSSDLKSNKNNKNNKETRFAFVYPPEFTETHKKSFEDFLSYKKEIRKPYKSPRSIEILLKRWSKRLPEFNLAIEEAVSNGWQGLVWDKKYERNDGELGIDKEAFIRRHS